MARVVGGKYKIRWSIGCGSFGEVYGASQIDSEELVAVKIKEKSVTLDMYGAQQKGPTRHSFLAKEALIYTTLQGGCGIPKIMWSGMDQDDDVLVLELLGWDLEHLLKCCGGTFTLKTVLMLAIQMIQVLEYVHSKGFLHRDIKPDNFVMGIGQGRKQVYIIDFGLAISYLDDTNCHILRRKTTSITGTARYASVSAHLHYGHCRRDDLESLGFVFIYFLKGRLLWQGLSGAQRQNNDIIAGMKQSPEDFCMSLPPEFLSYFNYCRCLKFEAKPDYQFLKLLFLDSLGRRGFQNDGIFDWMDSSYQKRRTEPPPINPEAGQSTQTRQLPPLPSAIRDDPTNHDTASSSNK